VRRTAAVLVLLVAIAVPAYAGSYPTHVTVSLTSIPGNICCPKLRRATVSPRGVLTTATATRGGAWKTVHRRTLKPAELSRLRADLGRFNPADLKPNNSAGCHGLPIGDVGGNDLRVGSHESNCPPASANRLVKLLSGWLP
jgi:hypothetical protein